MKCRPGSRDTVAVAGGSPGREITSGRWATSYVPSSRVAGMSDASRGRTAGSWTR